MIPRAIAETKRKESWNEQFLTVLHDQLRLLEPELDVSDVTLGSEIASLDVDSLSILAALAAIEDRYGVRIPDGDLAALGTVADLAEAIMVRMR